MGTKRYKTWLSTEIKDQGPTSTSRNRSIEMFSIQSDLINLKKPIKQQYRALINDFKRYVKTKRASLDKEDLDLLDSTFIAKFTRLVNETTPQIVKGQYLSMLFGITDPDIVKAANYFSKQYKLLMKTKEKTGYIPKINQKKVDKAWTEMISDVRKVVFAPVITLFSEEGEGDAKTTLFFDDASAKEKAEMLKNLITGAFRQENIEADIDIMDDGTITVKPTKAE